MVLQRIQKILEAEEFTCSLFSANEQVPLDRLLVFLGLDSKKRERMLEVIGIQPPINPEYALPQATSLPFRIQFRIEIPFTIQDTSLNQVASLLLFINQFIDLPGFELDELNGKVIYRYVWLINSEAINATVIMSIMGAIMLNLSLFSETIESLAEGKMSFNDLLSQIVQMADRSQTPKESS